MTTTPPAFGRRHPARAIVLWRTKRFFSNPPSVRAAVSVIVAANATIVVLAAVAMWLLDHSDFPNLGLSLWWAVQTATTVGYGDVTPRTVVGRLVAAFVMLQGIALIAVVTASITSTFVARAQREFGKTSVGSEALTARLDEIDSRLEAIARALGDPGRETPSAHDASALDEGLDRPTTSEDDRRDEHHN